MVPSLSASKLEVRAAGSHFGLSASRLWQYTEMGQIDPFTKPVQTEIVCTVCCMGIRKRTSSGVM
jgi:hypothetical protein